MICFFTKRKSGNGTIARQDLYLMVNWPYFFIFKIGISRDAKHRSRQVSAKHPGTYYCVAVARIEFAYQVEQLLLSLTSLFYWPFFGGKEQRWGLLWVLIAPLIWLLVLLRYLIIMAMILLVFYIYWKVAN